jgi:esterase/lipase
MRLRSIVAVIGTSLALTATTVTAPNLAGAQSANPYQKGPAPTDASIEARSGSYSTTTQRVRSARGFGGGTIYSPRAGSGETFGALIIAPGYTATQSSIAWLGPRIASQGFVVFTIDTNGRMDQPNSRGRQLQAAIQYLTGNSPARGIVDDDRIAVSGHSMGGGGSLMVASSGDPAIKAAIPLTPWHSQKRWSGVQAPTLIISAQRDTVAPDRQHSQRFYTSMPASLDKAWVQLSGASHMAPNVSNTTIAKYMVSWMKRFVDDDTRYEQFLCGPNHTRDRAISLFEATCPFGDGTEAPPAEEPVDEEPPAEEPVDEEPPVDGEAPVAEEPAPVEVEPTPLPAPGAMTPEETLEMYRTLGELFTRLGTLFGELATLEAV